ncbi:MAG TPA: tetratricopeptide repeat protein [Candidatus Acidoferrales bacterium]|jgi:hypothetical protein|nr:tetratricopeptide repeat protein [Candidatus Acidoferrales bacterium]
MLLLNLAILAVIGAIVWWLTGYDKTVSGESKRGMYEARALRCLLVLFAVAVMLWVSEGGGGYAGGVLLLIFPVCIALLLRSCLSEIFTHGFLRMADPSLYDDRELDLKKTRRYQDTIAHMIHHGHRDAAIKLCEDLKKSGEVNRATLEAALEFLGVKQDTGPTVKPLNEAARLRATGHFTDAEKKLQALLMKNPDDADAAMLLMRLYAQDLRQPAKAMEVLLALEKQPRVAVAHIDFARRSIDEWSRPVTPPPSKAAEPAPPQSLDDLLAQGFFGSAIEVLEQKLREQPGDFDLLLRLATIQAVNCANLPRAEKLVRQIEADPRFTPEQAAAARAKLKEWHEARLQRK